jgi:hypothetical protein
MRRASYQGLRAAAFLALLALLAATGLGVFVHEDDGCAVEVHCQACVFALHPADGAAPLTGLLPFAGPRSPLPAPSAPRPVQVTTAVLVSRGPPAA